MTHKKITGMALLLLSSALLQAQAIAGAATSDSMSANATTAGAVATTGTAGLEQRREALTALLDEQWQYTLRNNPEFASMLGDKRYNDQLSDFSQPAIDAQQQAQARFLIRFEALDTRGFPAQEIVNKDLMVRQLKMGQDAIRFKDWQMPVLQNSGIHLDTPQMVTMLSFVTVKDYEDYIARLNALPRAFEQTIVQMRNGIKNQLMPPQFILGKIARQCDEIVAMKPEASPFTQPLNKFPADFSADDKQRLRAAIREAVALRVVPAYQKFSNFVRDEYAVHGRQDAGIWSLPDGAARYQLRVKESTTTDLTAEAIHQLGLSEVARIEGQMLAVAKKLGYADLQSFNAMVLKNPALHPSSREEILALYRQYTTQMYAKLPQLFGRLPKAKVEIMAVEEFREKEAAGASYNNGTPDGSRPGHVMVNTGDFADRTTMSIETTALHEGVPGHHMQISIAQELQGLPEFRKQGGYNAYVEGWALYSERLGEELGFYQDPYSYYGHLQDEMLRAIRLVVDTGLHYKKWNRQQVVDFFHDHSGIEEVDVQSETDRYIVWPGQALGYKIGQLKIIQLRAYATEKLGEKFDIRAFHDEVLGAGALPLDVLEQRIHTWVETKI